MGRKNKLTPEQVWKVRTSQLSNIALSAEMGVTKLTISKVRNFRGGYRTKPTDLGTPILDRSGKIIGVEEYNIETSTEGEFDHTEVVPVLPDTGE